MVPPRNIMVPPQHLRLGGQLEFRLCEGHPRQPHGGRFIFPRGWGPPMRMQGWESVSKGGFRHLTKKGY